MTVRINDSEINELFARLRGITGQQEMAHAFDLIGQAVVTSIDLGFREERDPWGRPWQPLSEYTLSQRRQGDGIVRILRDTGNLANSINYQVDNMSLTVGSGVRAGTGVSYASVHQYGEQGIPRRAFMPIDPYENPDLPPELRADILDVLRTHIDNVLNG